MSTYERVTFALPGKAYRIASEGCLDDLAREAIGSAVVIRRGRGRQAIINTTRAAAEHLAAYLWSVYEVNVEMTAAERGDSNEYVACQVAAGRIEAALRSATA